MNNHNYPKVFYPEIYVLEGGYCGFYKESRSRSRMGGYVRMDDPHHAASRKEDLDQFRRAKFGRTRSYAYGDSALGSTGSSSHSANGKPSKRSAAPASASSSAPLFAAANVNVASRSRRGSSNASNALLHTLAEDHAQMSDDDETDLGDSPCPPPTKTSSYRGKRLGAMVRAAPLLRAETFDPSRFAAGY
jgi:M-phase inducer tyrosine phosphatase